MAINSINGYTTTRLTGLSSGIDTDALIENALRIEQAKYDRLYQNKTKLEWKSEAYNDIINKVTDFTNKYMSQLSEDNVFSTNVYKSYKVNISEKYSAYFNISGTADASISQHSITKATLAEAATIKGVQYRNRYATAVGSANANSLASVSGNRKIVAVNGELTSLADLKYEDGSSVFEFNDKMNLMAFSVNGEVFAFDENDTLQDVINAVSGSDANVTMSFDNGMISFTSTKKGADSAITLENTAGLAVFGEAGAFGIAEGKVAPTSLINENMTLAEIADATGKEFGFDNGMLRFSINNVEFEFSSDTTLKDMMQKVNDNALAAVTMSYDGEKDQFTLRSDLQGEESVVNISNVGNGNFFGTNGVSGISAGKVNGFEMINRQTDTIAAAAAKMGIDLKLDSDGKFSFSVNGVDFSFNTTDTLTTMINTVNSNDEANVIMGYSQITDSFTFQSRETGADTTITVGNAKGVNAFGGADSFFGAAETSVRGTDATIVIDGETITQSSNSFVLDGISITLKEDFDSEDLGAATFNVEQDVDSVVDKMKSFVTAYNELTQSLFEMVTETVDYDNKYEPLTEEERSSLSEEEVEKWDIEAKKGLLRNDSKIQGLLSSLRNEFFATIEGTGLSAYSIGFNTSTWSSGEYGGQITFDEDKFRTMLEKDPDAVSRIMAQNTSNSTDSDDGLITRFHSALSEFKNVLRTESIASTTERIKDVSESMEEMLDKMYDKQERLYAQYASMETLLTEYQSQSDWLAQQLANLTA